MPPKEGAAFVPGRASTARSSLQGIPPFRSNAGGANSGLPLGQRMPRAPFLPAIRSCKSSLGMQSERAVVWGTSVQTPPARALLLALWGASRSRSALPFQSFLSFHSLQSLHSVPRARTLRRGGGGRRLTLHLSVINFGCHPHACAQGVFYVFVVGSEAPELSAF